MKIYTRSGDQGETSLFGGKRVPKHHPRVEAYGSVDELNSVLGMAISSLDAYVESSDRSFAENHASLNHDLIKRKLLQIQSRLFDIGADLATPPDQAAESVVQRCNSSWVRELESEIDEADEALTPLREFILPGGTAPAATLHLARTVCRRVERDCLRALDAQEQINPEVITYINRLSDWLFTYARLVNAVSGAEEHPWRPSNPAD